MPLDSANNSRLREVILRLFDYCSKHGWAGYDPYDALNSRLFNSTPFAKSKICRIAMTQLLKRAPINVRAALCVPRMQNPKSLGLFLASLLKLSRMGMLQDRSEIDLMVERLVALRSPNTSYWCWGYSFPWQGRKVLVSQWTPNLVCTTFVATALHDAYDQLGNLRYRDMAMSAGEYILSNLYWSDGETLSGFSYPLPGLRTQVHNANFLASSLLLRLSRCPGGSSFIEPALKAARCSARAQRDDGSWDYGQLESQRWVDNFHTGYNLCALRSIRDLIGSQEFEPSVCRGFEYYLKHFFTNESAPRYFANGTYPIDIHSVAQSIITLLALRDLNENSVRLAFSVNDWAIEHMWDRRGYFYYQVLPFMTNRISYMRWSQAWMLLALTTLLEFACKDGQETASRQLQAGAIV